jgi:hypothetical protein
MIGSDLGELATVLPRGEYIAVPSCRRPLIVASRDAVVLRYLIASVLSVPPGTSPAASLLLTVALRAFRYPASWFLAGPLQARAMVLTQAG